MQLILIGVGNSSEWGDGPWSWDTMQDVISTVEKSPDVRWERSTDANELNKGVRWHLDLLSRP